MLDRGFQFISTLFIIFLFFLQTSYSQDLFPEPGLIFGDETVPRIDITLPPDSLAFIFEQGNEESDHHFSATFQFDNGVIQETIENVGFRLRGNTSRYSQKKSFKVSFNTYEPGRDWYGVEKLNLNGEHNDPTVSRSKICWDLLRKIGVPAPRSAHVELFINGEYYGLYINVEHIDEKFVQSRFGNNSGNLYKCLWPADLIYLGDDPNLYKYMSGGRRAYDLKTNEDVDDYGDLAIFIDVLNNTPIEDLPCALEDIFNINSFLIAMAFDILSGNWDGPLFNKNNFYLYNNEATGKFEYIPYDLDNTLGIDWFHINWAIRDIYQWGHPNEPRPLYWRILEVDTYKDRFSYYLNHIIFEYFKPSTLFSELDVLQSKIEPFVINDPFYPRDYGFDMNDFQKGFFEPLPYNHTPFGIKDFASARRNASIDQLILNEIPAIISMTTGKQPDSQSPIEINAVVEDDHSVFSAQVCYQFDENDPIECLEMYDDGEHADDEPNDGLYGTILPFFNQSGILKYSIRVLDQHSNLSLDPVCGTYQFAISFNTIPLAVNEFLASNDTTLSDPFGEYDDWIEIHNYGTEPISLAGKFLSDNSDQPVKWAFPDTLINTGAYMIIWADDEEEQGSLHTNFKLSAGGEYIGIFDENEMLIDGIEFGPQETDIAFGRLPNGTGSFQALSPTPGAPNEIVSSMQSDDFLFPKYLIFPNPTSDYFSLVANGPFKKSYLVVLMDALGNTITQTNWEGEIQFDMMHLPSGIYILALPEEGIILGKILKI